MLRWGTYTLKWDGISRWGVLRLDIRTSVRQCDREAQFVCLALIWCSIERHSDVERFLGMESGAKEGNLVLTSVV